MRRWDVERGVEVGRIDLEGVQIDTIVIASDGTVFAGDDLGRITVVSAPSTRQIDAYSAG